MWPYPMPDRLGLELDLNEQATVVSVADGSAAAHRAAQWTATTRYVSRTETGALDTT